MHTYGHTNKAQLGTTLSKEILNDGTDKLNGWQKKKTLKTIICCPEKKSIKYKY